MSNMPRRPQQHQIEDLSRAKYRLVIPRNWVLRDKDKDYGIDAEVEIFDDNNRATGIVFWVQLKATEMKDTLAARKIDLEINVIHYYLSLELPVLIARYSAQEDSFYYKWAHEIDLFYAKKEAKTLRIIFGSQDIWNEDSAISMEADLKKIRDIKSGSFSLPASVFIEVKDISVNGLPRGILMSSIRMIMHDYSHILVLQNNKEKALFHTKIEQNDLILSLASLNGCTFHNLQSIDKVKLAENIATSIAIGLAVCLIKIGQVEVAARILVDSNLRMKLLQTTELLTTFLPELINTSKYGEIIDIICELIDTDEDTKNSVINLTHILAIIFLNSDNQNRKGKLLQILEKCLEKNMQLGIAPLIGRSYYNLGNYYRSNGEFRKSVVNFLKARKFNKEYLSYNYYYKEIAGSLFELEKYKYSAKIYKLALDRAKDLSIEPLYADALMFSGNYRLSHSIFSEYLEKSGDNCAEWNLKKLTLELLIDLTKVEKQNRFRQEAINQINISEAGTPSFTHNIKKAIELDNLCGYAWFNLGIIQSKANEQYAATFSFTLCGLVQKWDVEAWVNATLCSFNYLFDQKTKNYLHVFSLILNTAFFFNRDKYLSKLYGELSNSLEDNILENAVNVIEKLLSQPEDKFDGRKIRIFSDDDNFEEFSPENQA